MNTTLMRDSNVGDAWITEAMRLCPSHYIVDPATGNPTGDIRTCPVRLGYMDLFELPTPKPGSKNTSEPKYGVTLIFPPMADMSIYRETYYRVCAQSFANHYAEGDYRGLQTPFRDQVEMMKNPGYNSSGIFIRAKSKFQVPVVDRFQKPILIENRDRVYQGVWALATINAYSYPAQAGGKPGVAFGLQSIMIIEDDKPIFSKQADPTKHYAGVNVPLPIARPSMAGMVQTGGAAPPVGGIPGYTQMPPSTPPAGFSMPQQHFTAPPPVGNGSAPVAAYGQPPMVGVGQAPTGYAPNAMISPSSGFTPEEEAEMRAMGML